MLFKKMSLNAAAAFARFVHDIAKECAKPRTEPCVVCLDNPARVACAPCGHRCLCGTCGLCARLEKCPMCRHPIAYTLTVYDV